MSDQGKQERKPPKKRRRANGEGSIFRRSDGRFVGQVTLPDGKQKQVYGKSQEEVLQKQRKLEYEQRQGTLITERDVKLKAYLDHWIENVHRQTIRFSTYYGYRRMLDLHIIPTLGHIGIQKLTTQQLQTFYAQKLKEGLAPRSIRIIHAILHKAYQDALRSQPPLVARNVVETVRPPRIAKSEARVLSKTQARALLTTVKGHRLEALITLALVTGMRRGELLGLRWSDINWQERTLTVRHTVDWLGGYGFWESEPKTEQGRRTLPLPAIALEALKEHRTRQLEERLKAGSLWQNRDLVFPNSRGNYLQPTRMLRMFREVLQSANLPHMRFHELRHSAATLLLAMGVDARVIQEILGHSHISITLGIYGHVNAEMQQEAMKKMEHL
ncbi:MAG TPA: tyrosine-type recombinase/integrase, partial [Ktedonobacteraceae bacterium]|nr:tyrosine-type recombinase/integrase [Ktedonobacteraceae bacterium]